MKSLVTLFGLSALLSLVLADAPIINANAKGAIADQYIVVYKKHADLKHRKQHENEVNGRCKSKKKTGLGHTYSINGFNGYSVNISPEDLPLITKNGMVRRAHCFRCGDSA